MSLQSKIAPHFLFNSLNTISELCHEQPDEAEDAINALSKLLRSTLEEKKLFHSLDDEIKLCQQYISLEKWRLGDRLNLNWQIQTTKDQETSIPKLLIQPIIENAITHGVAPYQEPSNVLISITVENNIIIINIENTTLDLTKNCALKPFNGLGIATKNTKERLFVIYDDDHQFSYSKKHNGSLVTLKIPTLPPQR